MRNETKTKFKKLLFAIAVANSVAASGVVAGEQFAVSEPIETKLNDSVQASSEFLTMISMHPVVDMKGQALDMAAVSMIGGRTDTSGSGERSGTELGAPDGTTWEVAQTDFDVYIKYPTLDIWARYKDFYSRYMKAVFKAIALTRITIGWHGTHAAATTNKATYPLGQDVNKGWLQVMRDQVPENIVGEGKHTGTGKIFIGKNTNNKDYQNLDAAAYDLYQMIPVERRTGDEVVIVGAALVAADVGKVLTEHAGTPSEKKLGITTLSATYGGLKAVQVPNFPDNGLVVTDLKNLHLYYQEDRTRRQNQDEPKRNRINDWISSNDAYAIGDRFAIAAFEPVSVVIVNENTPAGDFA